MTDTKITRPFGGREREFCLTYEHAHMYEITKRKSLYGTLQDLLNSNWRVDHISEVIRLALLGGGADEYEVITLVDTYVHRRPLTEGAELATAILNATFFGVSNEPENDDQPVVDLSQYTQGLRDGVEVMNDVLSEELAKAS